MKILITLSLMALSLQSFAYECKVKTSRSTFTKTFNTEKLPAEEENVSKGLFQVHQDGQYYYKVFGTIMCQDDDQCTFNARVAVHSFSSEGTDFGYRTLTEIKLTNNQSKEVFIEKANAVVKLNCKL